MPKRVRQFVIKQSLTLMNMGGVLVFVALHVGKNIVRLKKYERIDLLCSKCYIEYGNKLNK